MTRSGSNEPCRADAPCCSECAPKSVSSQPIEDATSRRAGTSSPVFVGMPGGAAVGRGLGSVPLLRDAFRPFYLVGAAFAVIAMPLWLAMWHSGAPTPSLPSLYWHMHEMLFGFAGAIIVGFLFTAARNWTGLPLPSGVVLGAMVGVWAAARLAIFIAYGLAAAILDVSLLLLVAVVLARAFLRSGNHRNWPIVVVLSLLSVANAAFHGAMLEYLSLAPIRPVEAGLMLVVVLLLIIGGRVIPGFTANAVCPGQSLRRPWLHRVAIAMAVVAFGADLLGAQGWWVALPAMVSAVLLGVEVIIWRVRCALSQPLLRVLHMSFVWIPLGLVLVGLASLGVVPRSAAMHAFSVGALGGMILGMIVRTGMAHAGVPVVARRWETLAFLLIPVAAVTRLLGALVPAVAGPSVTLSGTAWTLAFLVYLAVHARILMVGRRGEMGRDRHAAAVG